MIYIHQFAYLQSKTQWERQSTNKDKERQNCQNIVTKPSWNIIIYKKNQAKKKQSTETFTNSPALILIFPEYITNE